MPLTMESLKEAFDFANVSPDDAFKAYIDRRTGQVYFHPDEEICGEPDPPLPEDIDSEHYVQVADVRAVGLGYRQVALDFAHQRMADSDIREVLDIFSQKGASARFEAMLAQRRLLDQYRDFRDEVEERALRAWCEDEGLELAD
jgi:hypothetical protein